MSQDITSALITGGATILSSGAIAAIAMRYSERVSKLKRVNQKLIDDCEFYCLLEKELLQEIEVATGASAYTKKKEQRKSIENQLKRQLNYQGQYNIKRLRK
jgi:hypothetical protein